MALLNFGPNLAKIHMAGPKSNAHDESKHTESSQQLAL